MKPLSLSAPHLIVMVGIPGSGKSFFAEHFATTFNAPYVSAEKIMTDLGVPREASGAVANHLLEQLFKTGQTVIYEGDSDTRSNRLDMAKAARAHGYDPLLVWVQTESISAKQRATRSGRGSAAMTAEQFDSALKRFTPPNLSEKAVVISGKHTYASQLKIVLKRLAEGRADATTNEVPARAANEGRRIVIR